MPPRENTDDPRGLRSLLFGDRGRNRWKGFVLGLIGANLGLIAMTYYQTQAAPVALRRALGDQAQKAGGEDRGGPFNSISLIGIHHEKGETSTAALGRIGYELLSGREPSEDETKELLSYLVHWIHGMLMGGLYGAARSGIRFPDLTGGLLFALGLWAFGDELAVPLLGLQSGPTASPMVGHLNRLAAHLLYGVGLAIATQALALVRIKGTDAGSKEG